VKSAINLSDVISTRLPAPPLLSATDDVWVTCVTVQLPTMQGALCAVASERAGGAAAGRRRSRPLACMPG
jgi:hypothetical protein